MIKQSSNSVIAKCRALSVSRRSVTILSIQLPQIIDRLATDKAKYFAHPRPIIVDHYAMLGHYLEEVHSDNVRNKTRMKCRVS